MNHQPLKNCILALSLALFSLPATLKCMEAEDARPQNYNPAAGSLLINAAKNNNLSMVETALKSGADPDFSLDANGWTALHYAANRGESPIIQKLKDAGATINKKNNEGNTPLREAIYKCHLPTVKLLITLGADVNTTSNKKHTPLHTAVIAANVNIIQTLLIAHANLEAKTNEIAVIANCTGIEDNFASEWTPLHYAVARGENYHVVELLLQAGADSDSKDSQNRTPGDIAELRLNEINRLLDMRRQDCQKIKYNVEQMIRILRGEQPLPENHIVPAATVTPSQLPQPRITTPQRSVWGMLFGGRNTK